MPGNPARIGCVQRARSLLRNNIVSHDHDGVDSNTARVGEQPPAHVPTNEAIPDKSTWTLLTLARVPRWVAWRPELRGDRLTKVPYSPHHNLRKAESDNPTTWGFLWEAWRQSETIEMPHGDGGVGIMLGRLNDAELLGGIDLDTCIKADRAVEDWAQSVLDRVKSYTEFSPSLTGLKVYFLYDPADLSALRDSMGGNAWTKVFKRGGDEHPPAIELHLGNRFFAVTATPLEGVPEYPSSCIPARSAMVDRRRRAGVRWGRRPIAFLPWRFGPQRRLWPRDRSYYSTMPREPCSLSAVVRGFLWPDGSVSLSTSNGPERGAETIRMRFRRGARLPTGTPSNC